MEIFHTLNEKRFTEQTETEEQFNRFDEHVAGAE
jgi:hypothetical protein